MEQYEDILDNLCVVVYSSKDACVLNTFPSWNVYANRLQVVYMPGITEDARDECCIMGNQVWLNPLYGTVYRYEIKGDFYRHRQMPVGSILLMEDDDRSLRGEYLCFYLCHKKEPFFSAMTEKVNEILKDYECNNYGCKTMCHSSVSHTTGSVCGYRGD